MARIPDCLITYDELANWYKGYSFLKYGPLFNPRSVIYALNNDFCESYWADSASNEQFRQLLSLQRDTLRKEVEKMLWGEEVPVNMSSFDNDLRTLPGADGEEDGATLAAMIHLGYLSFDQATRSARIPNKEISLLFLREFTRRGSRNTGAGKCSSFP